MLCEAKIISHVVKIQNPWVCHWYWHTYGKLKAVKLRHRESVPIRVSTIEVSEFCFLVKTLFFDDLFSKKSLKSMVLQGFASTFNFWGFVGLRGSLNWKTLDFNDLFSKKSLKSMVLSTFNFWGFCGPYRDFLYYCSHLKDFSFRQFEICFPGSKGQFPL